MNAATVIGDLTREEYQRVRTMVYAQSGINLGDSKMTLVRSRLNKRVRSHGFATYSEYLDFVESDASGDAMCELLDSISTNTTHLFREIEHFHFLKGYLQQWIGHPAQRAAGDNLRIWSAACSSGEEPYSIAMTLHQGISAGPRTDAKILATDISTQMLDKAKAGVFAADRLGPMPAELKQRYLRMSRADGKVNYTATDDVRSLISFARFNLMTPQFPFKYGFDIVFCRNVMIYFDKQTQEGLINRITSVLRPRGFLLIGHSESLNGIKHQLSSVEPAIYQKKG